MDVIITDLTAVPNGYLHLIALTQFTIGRKFGPRNQCPGIRFKSGIAGGGRLARLVIASMGNRGMHGVLAEPGDPVRHNNLKLAQGAQIIHKPVTVRVTQVARIRDIPEIPNDISRRHRAVGHRGGQKYNIGGNDEFRGHIIGIPRTSIEETQPDDVLGIRKECHLGLDSRQQVPRRSHGRHRIGNGKGQLQLRCDFQRRIAVILHTGRLFFRYRTGTGAPQDIGYETGPIGIQIPDVPHQLRGSNDRVEPVICRPTQHDHIRKPG